MTDQSGAFEWHCLEEYSFEDFNSDTDAAEAGAGVIVRASVSEGQQHSVSLCFVPGTVLQEVAPGKWRIIKKGAWRWLTRF